MLWYRLNYPPPPLPWVLASIMLAKNLAYTVVCQEKNSITRGLGKKVLSKPYHPYPRLKSQMVSP